MEYNKLVRDKIDKKIISNGEIPITRILNDEEFKVELIKKIKEEFTELEEAIDLNNKNKIKEETADLIEVLKTYNELTGNSFGDVITTMVEKREKRGGFTRKLFLERVEK